MDYDRSSVTVCGLGRGTIDKSAVTPSFESSDMLMRDISESNWRVSRKY
jgi:hypothetical protein